MPKLKKCPRCGGNLCTVPPSKWLNSDQWQASKAGDYYCVFCPGNGRGAMDFCYWWEHEIEEHEKRLCAAMCRL